MHAVLCSFSCGTASRVFLSQSMLLANVAAKMHKANPQNHQRSHAPKNHGAMMTGKAVRKKISF